ncbi:DUF4433 domain-containing protein [Vibrio neonatus]|uniref:DUF4433 domain-containing protein n=1 Tax=Vibrio neonatus TaxID=278860 RepID=UPI0021C458FB|nr:DUF4433 domain-containing protein [Vibrio neonatus]
MNWLSKLWQRTKEVATLYTGTFIVVMFLNQLLFFGLCLNPVCLIAAVPHVLFITVVIGTWLNRRESKRKKEVEKVGQTSYQPKTAISQESSSNRKNNQLSKPLKKAQANLQTPTGVVRTGKKQTKKLDNSIWANVEPKAADGSNVSRRPAVDIRAPRPTKPANTAKSQNKPTVDISKLIESNKAKLKALDSQINKTAIRESNSGSIKSNQSSIRPSIKLADKKHAKEVLCPRCSSNSCFKNGNSGSGAAQFKCSFVFAESDIAKKSVVSSDSIFDVNRNNIYERHTNNTKATVRDRVNVWKGEPNNGCVSSRTFGNFGVTSLWHMTHIDNVKNILQHGILSNSLAHSKYSPKDISNADVQEYRKQSEPIYRRKLHDYAPTYISIKNPMLFAKKDLSKQLCLLEIDISALRAGQFLLSDGNAASRDTAFYSDIGELNKLPWDVINSDYWSEHHDGKRKKCAEVLIYPKIESRFIKAIHCNSIFTKRVLEGMLVSASLIKVSPDMFFK